MRCPKCGRESPEQARFCRSCGERLAPEGGDALAPRVLTPDERSRRLLEDAFRLSEEGRVQQAIQVCQQAIALNPTSTSAHSLLGTLYERIGDRDGAIREYEQVLTLSPGSTVERRRLNELMGIATASEQAAVAPRTARMAVTGGFIVVALVLVGLIVFTQQGPQPGARPAGRQFTPRQTPVAGGELTPPSFEVAPPRLGGLGRTRIASLWAPPPSPVRAQPRQQQFASEQGYGQSLGHGAFQLPAATGPAYGGLANRGPSGPAYGQPPIEGAIPYRSNQSPAVRTQEGYAPRAGGGAGATGAARVYYLQGDYQRAVNAYRGYVASNPQAPAPREELAWVYTQAGNYNSAKQEYRTALDQYRAELDRGHNVEAARHGVRTCESAIRALETQ